ncbi:MAG: acetate--CoA ligase [Candidatus Methanomethylicaceae archaeon]|nr:acetate--CoA ligase [Candidatus Verstraetearchaeota archaeon]
MEEIIEEIKALPLSKNIHPDVNILKSIYKRSIEDPESFWRKIAEDLFWYEKNGPAYEPKESPPYAYWFKQWKTNISYNALDRHIESWRKNKVAYYWESESGERRTLTYYDLYKEVNRFAYVLRNLGIKKGDRVTIYMPMIPELPIAMLATVRLGAIHSVVFSGFASHALADRINDCQSRIVITTDGAFRRGRLIDTKSIVDDALNHTKSVEKVLIIRRAGNDVNIIEDRDYWYYELAPSTIPYIEPEKVEGIHPSFILYTSGTTGKPKGITHSTGGYMVWAYFTLKTVFDVNDKDIFWCTADIGWITGHTYVVYGPLLMGLTSIIYEGAPDYPRPDRWWSIIEDYGVTILYTSPTAIRMHMKYGEEWIKRHDLSSLRILGSVGEPINPEVWNWYYKYVGQERTPIVDTWWQTETGGIMISPQPGLALVPLKPGSATLPLPGVEADVFREDGKPAKPGEKGYLVITKPWPGCLINIWGDEERFINTYYKRFPGVYYTGDFAVKDDDGYFWLLGRADEVLKVAGHRIGTAELEAAFLSHKAVAEAAVVGKSDPVKMQVPVAFIVLRPGHEPSPQLRMELIKHIRETIGSIATPHTIYFLEKLPKTRSGKIMRRVLSAIVEDRSIGDITTIEDETSIDEVKKVYNEFKNLLSK